MDPRERPEDAPYLPPLSAEVRKNARKVLEWAVKGKNVPDGWRSALVIAWRLLARNAAERVVALFPQDWWVVCEAPGQHEPWNVFVAGDDGKPDHERFVATFREETDARRLVENHNRPLGEMSGLLGAVEKILGGGGEVDWP